MVQIEPKCSIKPEPKKWKRYKYTWGNKIAIVGDFWIAIDSSNSPERFAIASNLQYRIDF